MGTPALLPLQRKTAAVPSVESSLERTDTSPSALHGLGQTLPEQSRKGGRRGQFHPNVGDQGMRPPTPAARKQRGSPGLQQGRPGRIFSTPALISALTRQPCLLAPVNSRELKHPPQGQEDLLPMDLGVALESRPANPCLQVKMPGGLTQADPASPQVLPRGPASTCICQITLCGQRTTVKMLTRPPGGGGSVSPTLGPVCPGIPLAPSLPARPWNGGAGCQCRAVAGSPSGGFLRCQARSPRPRRPGRPGGPRPGAWGSIRLT